MNLRPMLMTDANFLLELKNYPETRKFAIASHEEIKKEDHLKYLEANLEFFKVLQNESGVPLGAVRISDNEISIWIKIEHWGQGIATWVLESISEKGHTAKIVEDNIPSMRCFINAGFKPVKKNSNYYIFQK